MGNPLFHWELMVDDVDQTIDFYSKVFDWEFDQQHFPNYPLIKTGMNPGGAIFPKPKSAINVKSQVNVYFHVEDIEHTITLVQTNGGTVVAPKMAIPGIGYYAMFTDPEGVNVGILQME